MFKVGETLVYNDGRAGHVDVAACVLDVDAKGMLVQFSDRAAPTYILFTDKAWMDHMRRLSRPDAIRAWVQREFAPQHVERVVADLIDVATGNREGNAFERSALDRADL